MKLNIKFLKNIGKMLIIGFLIIYCVYILYFFNSNNNLVEGFEQDCSKCEMKPTSGNCKPIYDFSYQLEFIKDDQGNVTSDPSINFQKIDTSYVFCPWEQNCPLLENIKTQDQRRGLSNEDISDNMGLNNITCCSGEAWYDSNTIEYYSVYEKINNINDIANKCNTLDQKIEDIAGNPTPTFLDSYKTIDQTKLDLLPPDKRERIDKLINTNEYSQIRQFCLIRDKTHPNYERSKEGADFSGMLFEKNIEGSGNILNQPDLSVREILDYLNHLELSMNEIEDSDGKNSRDKIADEKAKLIQLNRSKPKPINFNTRKREIQKNLAELVVSQISYETYSYQLLNNNLAQIGASDQYLLNDNQFFNCFGDISNIISWKDKNLYSNDNMTGVAKEKFNPDDDINYFGVDDPKITTVEDSTQRPYPNEQDLEMELKNLEQIQPGGTAPVSVINQYLTAINGFYEKQMANMMGPKTHAKNDQLVFENDTLDTKSSTFFVYETDPNNEYECQPSVTNIYNAENDKFKYCGPEAYYTEFKQ